MQDKFFGNMCKFGAQADYRRRRITISYFLGVVTINVQYCMLNPNLLDFITGCIMKDDFGNGYFKKLSQKRMNLVDVSISSYFSILNSPKQFDVIKKINK